MRIVIIGVVEFSLRALERLEELNARKLQAMDILRLRAWRISLSAYLRSDSCVSNIRGAASGFKAADAFELLREIS